ncbi:MAG: hypothetical protein AAFP97_07950 [Pseudomonadota bacterium]
MKALILPVLVSISAAGGVFAANMLNGGSQPAAAPASGGDAYGAEASAKDASATPEKTDTSDYMRFKRQFVVPVMRDQAVEALVLLNIGLDIEESKRDEIFKKEPRFRDSFIRELLQLSNDGYFNEEMTSPDTYEVVRETLLRSARTVQEKGVNDVLILDFSRQDR